MNNDANKKYDLSPRKPSPEEAAYFTKERHFVPSLFAKLRERAGIDLREMTLDEAIDKFIKYYFE